VSFAGALGTLLAIAALAVAAPASAGPGASLVTRVVVTAGKPSEFAFKLSKRSVPRGKVTFAVTNGGTVPHDFKVCSKPTTKLANACAGKGTKMLAPGKGATLAYTFAKAGRYEYLCTVPGHAIAGMKGILRVT
jgi:uncharacterized cupredoxin-like copper-binding protein